jgi:hypothetical protein
MVKGPTAAAIILIAACGQAHAATIDLRAWVAALPKTFTVSGVKDEPTYLAAIDIWRQGDASPSAAARRHGWNGRSRPSASGPTER